MQEHDSARLQAIFWMKDFNVHIFKLAKGWLHERGLSTLDKVERD